MTMLASSASTPSASASSGLTSTERTQGKSSARCESAISAPQTAARSAGGRPRKPASCAPARVRATRAAARPVSSGGSSIALSCSRSTATPPAPKTTTGPNTGSRPSPAISSSAPARRTIGCNAKPSIATPAAAARAAIARAAASASAAVARSSATPPSSDLCSTSAETSLTTTLPPPASIAAASAATASGVAARRSSGTGRP